MKLRLVPKEIATQIILLVILSALIFHICISAAFLIGRGYFRPNDPAANERFVNHVADFMKLADDQPIPFREKMLDWFEDNDPLLEIKRESSPNPSAAAAPSDPLIEAIQSRIGSAPRIYRKEMPETSKPSQRIGFQFEDGTGITMQISPSHPPPDFFPRYRASDHVSNDNSDKRPSRPRPSPMIPEVFGTLLFIAITFTIFLLWAARALTRPLRKFAETVDRFQPDGTLMFLEENGPSELRGAARALNRMQGRVKSMIEQRTRMLAAISHDLRTPLTRLSLRAEFVGQDDIREPILRDIEQMEAMVHSALSFIRDGVNARKEALLDLSALLRTICDDFADMGHEVRFETSAPITISGNQEELYRAVTNLVSNGVNYGNNVEIHVRRNEHGDVEIDVIDDGPGIPENQKAEMLVPFMRGDESRNLEDSRGFGLGLPIVQAIVAAHRGSFRLVDREPHGLIARITLPGRQDATMKAHQSPEFFTHTYKFIS